MKYLTLIQNGRMEILATVDLVESFNVTGRGFVIVGDIIEGQIRSHDFLNFLLEGDVLKLEIAWVERGGRPINWETFKMNRVGIGLKCISKEQQDYFKTIKVKPQTATVTSE